MVAVYLRLSPPPGLLINRIVTAICTDSPMRKSLKSTSPRSIRDDVHLAVEVGDLQVDLAAVTHRPQHPR